MTDVYDFVDSSPMTEPPASEPIEPVIQQVQVEQGQFHDTRKPIFVALEKLFGRSVVTFFNSFNYPAMIEDNDADMLEGILQKMDLSAGLALIINSPGGIGLASERIVNVCRSYSKTGEFWAIVPGKAKSAATMVCFGASKIFMGPSSELGPVDPQWSVIENGKPKRFSLCNVVQSYEDLFNGAVACKGNVQPFLQQLSNYDAREIMEFKAAIDLAKDITVRSLASGMMKGKSTAEIEKAIKQFLTPEQTKSHGRPIYRDEVKSCGLNVEFLEVGKPERKWETLYEMYIRTSNYSATRVSKCIESKSHTFAVQARNQPQQ